MSIHLTNASREMHRNSNCAVPIRACITALPILLTSILLVGFLSGCVTSVGLPAALSGHLLVAGSTALQPLASAAAARFQQQHPGTHIDVQGGGSVTGLKAVTGKQADIGTSDIYADPASYPDPNLTDHIVCVIPFTMIVNLDVTVSSLTRQQIIDIFSPNGNIHNWREVGGPNLPIMPVVRPSSSGTRDTFRKYVLGGGDENGTLLTTDSSTTVRDTVAHMPGAIGYLARSVLDNSVRAIAIDGQMATPENITAGRYTFWSYEHMYTLGDDSALLAAFLDFMMTSQVQQLAQQMGYIPIANMKLPSARATANMQSQNVYSVSLSDESEVTRREFSW